MAPLAEKAIARAIAEHRDGPIDVFRSQPRLFVFL